MIIRHIFHICTGKTWWLQLYWFLYNLFVHFEWLNKTNLVVLTERHLSASSRADILPDLGHAAFRCFVTNSRMVKLLNLIFSRLMFRPLQIISLLSSVIVLIKSCHVSVVQLFTVDMRRCLNIFCTVNRRFARHDGTKQSVLKFKIKQGAVISWQRENNPTNKQKKINPLFENFLTAHECSGD